jgi:diacylglycerol O-acyltransferase / wax synthase
MAKSERMSSVDTAWLRMDTDHNLMMIVGVMMFEGKLNYARLRRTVEARMLRYRRFRQRVVEDATGAQWVDDDHFNIDLHLRRHKLKKPAGQAQLQAYVAGLAGKRLDPAKPLWQMHYVENYGTGSALVVRIHHCIGDGIALIGVMLSLTDETPDAPIGRKATPSAREEAAPAAEENFLEQLFKPVTAAAAKAMQVSGNAWGKYVDLVSNPGKAVDYAGLGAGIASELAKLALMPNDSATRFKGKPGNEKSVAWSVPMPLDEVKAVGKALGCSVNDVLMACAAASLRGYLAVQGDETEGVEVRALIPVNLRPPGEHQRLGNRFGLVALVLPVGMANPLARLHEVHRLMQELKGSFQAAITLGILGVVGLCPKPVQKQVLDMLGNKASAVMTNVPGPQSARFLAGHRIAQQMFWVPQSGDIGMGLSILTYDGKVQIGLITDRKLVPDPESIANRFALEFERLMLAVLMEPWGEPRDPSALEAELIAYLR